MITTEYAVRFSRTMTSPDPTDRWAFGEDREQAEGSPASLKSRGTVAIAELQTREVHRTEWETK